MTLKLSSSKVYRWFKEQNKRESRQTRQINEISATVNTAPSRKQMAYEVQKSQDYLEPTLLA